jgi:hypothetical protein
MAPDADTGEEVDLGVPFEVAWSDIANILFCDIARRDMAGGNKIAKPLRGVRVNFVV